MSSPFTVGRRKKIYGPAGRQFGSLTASDLSLYFLFRCKLWWWNFKTLIPRFFWWSTIRRIIVNSWRYTKKKLVFVNFYRDAILASPRNLASFLLEFASKIHHVFNSKCLNPSRKRHPPLRLSPHLFSHMRQARAFTGKCFFENRWTPWVLQEMLNC